VSGGTTTSFDIQGAWSELTMPFEGFMNSIQTISPGDVMPFSASGSPLQIPSSIPGSVQGILVAVLTFFSWIFGWMKAASDWLASLVVH
ncbi:MAG TPA: hypothetical protein VMT81_03410, partial [Candidatus Paceibacterota bacterium]|nr:hypothetical protein [Candidatus Paceibacterota bacterium]